jgi:hypothetical protein
MRAAILIIASFIGASVAPAQTWRLRESNTTLKGPHHELLPRPGGEILTITHPDPGHNGPMIISRFDAKLNELYTRRIDLLSHEQYQAAWYAAGHLFLFTTDKYGGLTRYELDDQSGGLIGTPLPLTLLGKMTTFYAGHSITGEYHYIAAATKTSINGILLDAQGNKTTVFQYATTTPPTDFIQTANGELSVIFKQTLLHIGIAGVCQSFPLPDLSNASCLSWSADKTTLRFSALLREKTSGPFTAILTGALDPATGALSDLHHTPAAALTPHGLPQNLTLLRELPLSDGSQLVLFESSDHRLYQNQWSTGGFTSISPSAQGESYLRRGDIYILKFDPANTPQWIDVVSKDQEESDRLTAIGAGCLVDAKDNLHVFFYDNPRNNTFGCTTISPNGAEKKQFIPINDNHYRLMPEIAFVDNKDQACFLAIRAKPGFSNELAFDRAGYKLGVISIE